MQDLLSPAGSRKAPLAWVPRGPVRPSPTVQAGAACAWAWRRTARLRARPGLLFSVLSFLGPTGEVSRPLSRLQVAEWCWPVAVSLPSRPVITGSVSPCLS